MKKQISVLCILIILVCTLFLSGSIDKRMRFYGEVMIGVEHVGQVPEQFKKIVENNVFQGVSAFDGKLLKQDSFSEDEENGIITHQVWMMDIYGKELASYTCNSEDTYHITTLTATDDGGFLFTLGFEDHSYGDDVWASDKGFASRVIKCDSKGNLQFDTPLDGVNGGALEICYEKNGQFYLFGQIQTPETKIRGVYSQTDIYMTILDKDGKVLKSRYIAGSDFDNLKVAEMSDDRFILSIYSQSDDGDFAGSDSGGYPVDWVITVNDNLEIIEKKKESGRDFFDYMIGEKDGVPVHRSDAAPDDFYAGSLHAFIDYGDFYLLVSTKRTGRYENQPPMFSHIWYYCETVYSAYDYNDNLIFRTSVDSSPDYDAMSKKYNHVDAE